MNLRDLLNEVTASAFGVPPVSTQGSATSLTEESLQTAVDLVYPILYYGTEEVCERGKLIYVRESELNPEFVVFHPDDFEQMQTIIPDRRLVHIRDYKPDHSKRFRPFETCEHGVVKNLCPVCDVPTDSPLPP